MLMTLLRHLFVSCNSRHDYWVNYSFIPKGCKPVECFYWAGFSIMLMGSPDGGLEERGEEVLRREIKEKAEYFIYFGN